MRYYSHNPNGQTLAPTTRIIRKAQTHVITRQARHHALVWNMVGLALIVGACLVAFFI